MNNMNTTPQRPQQQRRRQRHTTISDEAMATPKLHSTQSSSSLRQQRRTPQQHQFSSQQRPQAAIKLQRQHSVSCCTPSGKLTPPQLLRFQKATAGSQASLFAGSKYMESPAPDTIPMPPMHWFSTDLSPSRARTSPTPSSISDLSSTSSFEDAKSTTSSEELLLTLEHHRGGFRVNPLHLIAAVSAIA